MDALETDGSQGGKEDQKEKDSIARPPEDQDRSYNATRFNSVRHGVLSACTVLPWEDEAEYCSLLGALVDEYAPRGPTEDHLIEEIAGVIWRKRRLRLAEAAAYRRGLEKNTEPFSNTVNRALVHLKGTAPLGTIMDAVTATPSGTAKDLDELEECEAAARSALGILRAGKAGAYEAALAELDERAQRSWQEELSPELEDSDEDEDLDGDTEPYTADAAGLADYLESLVLPRCARRRGDVENRPLIRAQALGEALDPAKLEPLGRYEVHLDRKLERMLTILLRLQGLRRSADPG